jgi:dTDP-4-dehydrorhamnose 3,5-epimerase-like enzyme
MSFGATWTDYSTQGFDTDPKVFEFSSWDAGKTRGCVCDATFGDVDCSKRMCPYGNDVLDVRDDLYETQYDNVQQITVSITDSLSLRSPHEYANEFLTLQPY